MHGEPADEIAEALVAETVAVVMRVVRERQTVESVTSAQTARLIGRVLAFLAGKGGNHDTLLRVAPARFARWAIGVREGICHERRREKS